MFNHTKEDRAKKKNFTILFPHDAQHIKVKTDTSEPTEATKRFDGTRNYAQAMRPGRFLTRQITRGQSPIESGNKQSTKKDSPWAYINDHNQNYL